MYTYVQASLKSMYSSQRATTAKYLMSGEFRGGFSLASERNRKSRSAALAGFWALSRTDSFPDGKLESLAPGLQETLQSAFRSWCLCVHVWFCLPHLFNAM